MTQYYVTKGLCKAKDLVNYDKKKGIADSALVLLNDRWHRRNRVEIVGPHVEEPKRGRGRPALPESEKTVPLRLSVYIPTRDDFLAECAKRKCSQREFFEELMGRLLN